MSIDAPHRAVVPDALRCPDLHDFSDLRGGNGRLNRPLLIVLAAAAVLTFGHFVYHGTDQAPVPVAEHVTATANG
jgi:hypothetical protein